MSGRTLTDLVRSVDLPALRAALPGSRNLLVTRDADGHTPLHWAAMSDTAALLPLLVPHLAYVDPVSTAPQQAGQTPLHWACVGGHVRSVRTLLAAGADPALADEKGYNAATHAAQYGCVDVMHVLLLANPRLAASSDLQGHSLLQWAAYYDHHPLVRYLLVVHEVDPDAPDHTGMSPLHRAAQRDNSLVLEALLRGGADLTVKDGDGHMARELASEQTRSWWLLEQWRSGRLTRERPVAERRSLKRYGFVLFYYVVLAMSYWKYYWLVMGEGIIGVGANALAHFFLVVSVAMHLQATFRNPGDIEKGTRESFVQYINQCVEDDVSETRLVPSAYCYTCLVERPPRSKHSRERDVCVRRFDHECPWVNNTVGLYTHKPLLLLVLSTGFVEAIFIYGVVKAVYRTIVGESLVAALLQRPLLCALVIIHTAVGIFCVILLCTHMQLVARGQTTYEHLVATREKLGRNPYDNGAWNNIVAFLTSTGPGTGNPWAPLSMSSLREVVLSTGNDCLTAEADRIVHKQIPESLKAEVEKELLLGDEEV